MRYLWALVFGVIVGWAVPVFAQAPASVNITQTGTWQVEVECAAQTALTVSVDGGPAQPVAGLTWTGTGPFKALVDYPATAAARTLGAHTFVIANPGAQVTLADGSTVTYNAGAVSATVNVYADPPGNPSPPKILRWLLKVGGTIAAIAGGAWAWTQR